MTNKFLKILALLAFSTVVGSADVKVNEQVLPGGGEDVAMIKDHMAVVVTGGVDFYDMDYSNFEWTKVQSVGVPNAYSVDIDGEFAIVGAPSSVGNIDYLYALKGSNTNTFLRYDVLNDSWDAMNVLPRNANYGAALAAVGNKIYAIAGGNDNHFYVYDIATDSWGDVNKTDGVTPVGYYGRVESGGGSLVFDGGHYIYGTLGVNQGTLSDSFTSDLRRFDLEDPDLGWFPLENIPKYHTFGFNWGGCAYGCALASDGTYIYLAEGSTDGWLWSGDSSQKVLRFDPSAGATGTWSDWSDVGTDIGSGGSLTYNDGKLYLLAGKTGSFLTGDGSVANFVYDLSGSTWTSLGDLPKKAAAGASIVYGGEDLFALRGTGTATFMKYNFDTSSWTTNPLGNVNTGVDIPIGPGGALASQAFSQPDTATIFKRNATTGLWELKTEYPLANPQVGEDDRYGHDVGIHDNTDGTARGYVGIPNRSHETINSGRGFVQVITWDSSTPPIHQEGVPDAVAGTELQEKFGSSIDIDLNHNIIVGDRNRTHATTFGTSAGQVPANSGTFVNNVAIEGNVSVLATDTINEWWSFDGTWTFVASEVVAEAGSVSIDHRVIMSTNAANLNEIHFWALQDDSTLETGGDTSVSLTTSPLVVATKSDFYKDMAAVNDTTNNQALALDVPCGLRPTQLVANEWAIVSVPCGDGTARIGAIFGDDVPVGQNILCIDDDPNKICNWAMYEDGPNYTGKSADNVQLVDELDTMEVGKGYWIIWDQDVTLKADSTAITTRTQISRLSSDPTTPYAGWHDVPLPPMVTGVEKKIMIGNPFPRAFKWADLFIKTDAQFQSFASLPVYNAIGYVYDTSQAGQPYRAITATGTPGIFAEVKPYEGVWIKDLGLINAASPELAIPFER